MAIIGRTRPIRRKIPCAIRATRRRWYQTDRLECACRVVLRFGRARKRTLWSNVTLIGSFLISDLAGPSTEVIDLADIVVLLPILFSRVGALYAHAPYGHFGPIRLRLRAVSDRQRDAGL
jgi:hypothetical protein